MIIREYPAIKKGNRTVIRKTDFHAVTHNFIEQLQQRGVGCLNYFKDRNNENENCSGISWTEDFDSNDLINLNMSFLMELSDREKLAFSTQLHNIIISEVICGDDDEYKIE